MRAANNFAGGNGPGFTIRNRIKEIRWVTARESPTQSEELATASEGSG
jgi:hypothetical protein